MYCRILPKKIINVFINKRLISTISNALFPLVADPENPEKQRKRRYNNRCSNFGHWAFHFHKLSTITNLCEHRNFWNCKTLLKLCSQQIFLQILLIKKKHGLKTLYSCAFAVFKSLYFCSFVILFPFYHNRSRI